MMISAPAQRTMVMMLATTPVTWLSGTAAIDRSAAVSISHDTNTTARCMMLHWVSIPPMRRAQHRQHEFEPVAEQHRDAVAALQAELLKPRCDLRRLLRDVAPCHSRGTADQRLAIRIGCNRFGHHRRNALGPFAKSRNDT